MAILAMTLACWTVAACAQRYSDDSSTDERQYDCDAGKSFSAAFSKDRVRIDTKGYSYELEKRPSSVGVRYGSKRVAFAQDEDRAVLIGAGDGPYQGCTETGFRIDR
jgi:hypothetical protein